MGYSTINRQNLTKWNEIVYFATVSHRLTKEKQWLKKFITWKYVKDLNRWSLFEIKVKCDNNCKQLIKTSIKKISQHT